MEVEEQEKIFTEIYNECDNNHINNVQVSSLLSYIGPYIDSNSHHFEELKKSLDPNDLNPFIDKQTFMNAMMGWSEKFKNEVDFNFNNEEISRQSSPTTMTLKVDCDALNLSSISGYSLTGSVLSTVDPNVLQEQNNELQHQNKKLSDCLDDVKYQLTVLEEQNVVLQNQIDHLQKTSTSDQKLVKTLLTKCAEFEKEREEHTNILHENKVNHENLVLNKRIKNELENRIKELETQNKMHLDTIEKLTDELNEKDEENEIIRKQITDKDLEMQEKELEWKQTCKQNELDVEHYISEINELKSHIQSLKAIVENDVQEQKSFKMENFEPELKENDNLEEGSDKNTGKAITINAYKSRSLSPEDDFCVPVERRTSPQESLLSELANISTTSCFHSCEYRINQLEDEVNKLYDELKVKSEKLAKIESTNMQLEMQLSHANKEIKTRNDQYNTLTSELQELKTNLVAVTRDKQQLHIEKKQLNSKLTYYKVINKNFKVALDTKTSEIIAMKKKLKAKDEKLLEIEEMEKEIKVNLDKVNREISTKENENKMKNEEIERMRHELRVSDDEIKELKEINCKLMNEISSLERAAKLERKRNTRVDLNCKINELEEQLENVKSKNHQLTSSISSIILEKKQLICKLELLENNEYSKRKVESLESKLHKYRKTVTDLENQILVKTKEYQDLNDAYKKENANYMQLVEYIETVKVTINTNIDLLKSTIYYTSDIWKDILKYIFPELNLLNLLNTNTNINANKNNNNEILFNEINLLNNQINVITILLKAFAIMKSKMMIKIENEDGNGMETSLNDSLKKDKSKNKSILNIRKLCNSHESKKETSSSFLSKITPKRFSLKSPTLVVKPKNKIHFVFPSPPSTMIPNTNTNTNTEIEIETETDIEIEIDTESNNNNNNNMMMMKNIASTSTSSNSNTNSDNNSTFIKTCNDSLIEKILAEEKAVEPLLEQIPSNDEKLITNNKAENDENDDKEEEKTIKERLARQVRSLSEGAPLINQLSKDGEMLVFPHLQDVTLNQLGLIPKTIIHQNEDEDENENDQDQDQDQDIIHDEEQQHIPTKEHLTEEEIEEKFQTLAFAFNIDALTIKGRLEIQQRQRDQAERNLSAEIMKFKNAIDRLQQPMLYSNGEARETRELITGLLERVQLIVQATQRISTCAQILGSFQQEWRISDAVNLMLAHLKNVIKQRDAARKQLHITKKMLQESTSTTTILKKQPSATTRRLTINTLPASTGNMLGSRNVILPPRRASIAVISSQQMKTHQQQMQMQMQPKRIASSVCRTSDEWERPNEPNKYWDCKRIADRRPTLLSRPSRIDVNLELTKIQEGSTESFTSHLDADENSTDDEVLTFTTPTATTTSLLQEQEQFEEQGQGQEQEQEENEENPLLLLSTINNYGNGNGSNIKIFVRKVLRYYGQLAMRLLNEWAANGTLHEICFIGTIVCFTMATIFLCNTIMEIELARAGVKQIPWKWLSWKEIFSLFT